MIDMKLDELKQIWKQQKIERDMEYSQSELLMLINNKMISFEKDIRSRDRLEIIACALVVLIFGIWFFTASSLWTRIGCAIIVAGCFFIVYKLKKAQPKADDPVRYDHSIAEHLQYELRKVRTQKRLLKNVAWWYILPNVMGLFFVTLGFPLSIWFKAGYITLIIALAAWIWYMNQKAISNRFEPLIGELRDSINFIKSS